MMYMKKNIHFTSIVWKEGKYYVAQCLNVDVSSFGKTKIEALKNLEEALELYGEDMPLQFQEVRSPSVVIRKMQYV
jgi:predicted RNase H-like HicB family nuclease